MVSKVKQILSEESGQKAIMAIDDLLSQIFYSDPETLSEEEKDIVYIEELEKEINNGGFNQFFFNSSGSYTEEIIESLRKIGSVKLLSLVENAKTQFPNSIIPKDDNERQELVEKIQDQANDIWNELDNEFYKYEEDIYSLMLIYIEKNIEKFR
jgi:hypothetical protein